MAAHFGDLKGYSLLVLEDDAYVATRVVKKLRSLGLECQRSGTVVEATSQLETAAFDFSLLDVNLPDGSGLDLLISPSAGRLGLAIIMTAEGRLEVAVEAMRRGAVDFLTKPFDLEELPLVLSRVLTAQRLSHRVRHRSETSAREAEGLFFGQRLAQMRAQMDRIVAAEARLSGHLPPVLIEGETGVGKTTLARWLHQQGTRSGHELIEVNCATIPEALAESELFGHERGAFTDAKEARMGLLEAAHGSTLFLDEIASLPLPIQAKLLTAIEDGVIRRVGSQRTIPVNVRIMAATLKPLAELVAEGRFREDLRQRLDLLRLRVPPLRESPDDLPALAEHLLQHLAARYGMAPPKLSPTGHRRLLAHGWPGNVREVAHELERAIILEGTDTLDLSQLGLLLGDFDPAPPPAPVASGSSSAVSESSPGQPRPSEDHPDGFLSPNWQLPESGFQLEAAIRDLLRRSVAQCGGNLSAAARRLGVPRDYLRYRLKHPPGE